MKNKRVEELLVEYYAAVTDGVDGYDYTSGDLAGSYAKKIAATLVSDREKRLEKLARRLYADYYSEWPDRAEEVYADRMEELGIEVGE